MLGFCVVLRNVLSPERSLTKIWKFSDDGDVDVKVEEALDDDLEVRMLGDVLEES